MAEAAGLASAIITFIDVAAKIVSRVNEYLIEIDEAPQTLRDVSATLPLLSTSLQTIRDKTEKIQLQPDVVVQLEKVVVGASAQVKALGLYIEKLTPAKNSSALEKANKAVKGVLKYDTQVEQALKKLRQYLDTISFFHTIASVATTQEIVKALQAIGGDFTSHLNEDRNRLMRQWIGGASRDEYIDTCIANRAPGTCQWLQQSISYRKWSSNDFVQDGPKFLWVHGPPGIGKTFIAASVLFDLERDAPESTVAYFWSSEKHNTMLTDIVRSWLIQLCDLDPLNYDRVKPIWDHDQTVPARTKSVWKALTKVAQDAGEPLTFVIDGLDEYQHERHSREQQALPADRRLMSETITDFALRLKTTLKGVRCRIFCVSQSEAEIRSSFGKTGLEAEGFVAWEHEVISSDTKQDLLAYARLVVDGKLARKDASLRSDLANAIAEKAEGQMMWISLQTEQKKFLKPSMTDIKLREAVAATPTGLNVIYQENLERIRGLPENERAKAQKLLLLLLYALRPLSVQELFEAIHIPDKGGDDQFPDDELLEDPDEEDVRNELYILCGTFVTLDMDAKRKSPGEWFPRLVHSSVRQFLEKSLIPAEDIIDTEPAVTGHAVIGKLCLNYLACDNVWPQQCDTNAVPPVLTLPHHPFLKYAATYFPTHAGGKAKTHMEDSIKDFLFESYDSYRTWRTSLAPLRSSNGYFSEGDLGKFNLSKSGWDFTCRLAFAAGLGLPTIVLKLLQAGDEPNNDDTYPLIAACNAGSADTVKALLEHSADPRRYNAAKLTPLHCAAKQGSLDVLDLLLAHEVNLDAVDTIGCTPLMSAIRANKTTAAKFLIDKGADLNVLTLQNWCSLNYAAWKENNEVTELLLTSRCFDRSLIDNITDYGYSPLLQAVGTGNVSLVRKLVSHGADIWQIGRDGATSIFNALRYGKIEIAKLLFSKAKESVAHIELEDERDSEFVRLINQVTNVSGYSYLHAAVFSKQLEAVEVALENGVELDRKDAYGASALDHSIYLNCDLITDKLLKVYKTSDIGGEGSEYTLLHYACKGGSLKTFSLLLKKGLDIKSLSFSGESIMYIAAAAGSIDILEHILKDPKGLELLEVYDNSGYTPLLGAIEEKKLDCVKLLLKNHANIYAKTYDGSSTLDHAAYAGDIELVELILDADLPKDTITEFTLHCAARGGNTDVFRLINKYCQIDNSHSSRGGTVLHSAANGNNEEIVSLVLSQTDKSILHERDDEGCLALCHAVRCGADQIARSLVENGSRIADCQSFGGSAVMDASRKGNLHLLRYFAQIDREALMAARNRKKQTPLHVACEAGHPETAKWLVKEGFSLLDEDCYARSCLFVLARCPNWQIAAVYEESDWEYGLHRRDSFGCTPIIIAAACGAADSFRRFKKNGANVRDRLEVDWHMTVQDEIGATTLHEAAYSGSTEIVRMILDQFGKECLTWQDAHGNYPLIYAVCSGHEHLLDLLCNEDVPLTTRDCNGVSLLTLAVMYDNHAMTNRLLQAGLGKIERQEHSRIVELAGYCQVDTISSLEADGFDILADPAFPQLLHSAASRLGRGRLTEHLQKLGLNWGTVDTHGWTPDDCLLVWSAYYSDDKDNNFAAAKDDGEPKHLGRTWRKQPSWLKPSCWCPNTTNVSSFLIKDSPTRLTMSKHVDEPSHGSMPPVYSITADHYLLPTREDSYFEIFIKKCGKTNRVGVGLDRLLGEKPHIPGFCRGSIGFYGDRATVRYDGYDTEAFGEKFGQGDTIGVGIDYSAHSIFFTKNGVCLGIGGTRWNGRYAPAVASAEAELEIHGNFGQDPFMFNISSHGYGDDSCQACYGLSTASKTAKGKTGAAVS